jgi:DNA-binding beta-propeller fold protein YncE
VTTIDLQRSDSEAPYGIAFQDGKLWIATRKFGPQDAALPGAVLVVDAATRAVIKEIPVGKESYGLAMGLGSAWVANGGDGTVTRIDLKAQKVTQTITVGPKVQAIAVVEDSVWVGAAGGTLYRINPATNAVDFSQELGDDVQVMASGPSGLWVATASALVLIDQSTWKVAARIDLPGIAGLIVRGGTMWAADSLGIRVHEIDEATAKVRSSTVLGTTSWDLTELDGTLWVVQPAAAENKFADSLPGTVTRLDRR